MGFDILDGLKCCLHKEGIDDLRFVPENIGFGEDRKEIYSKAEKCLLQDDAQVVVAYLSAENAALLYPLFESTGRYLMVLDPGMNYPTESLSSNALHISLQGIHACYLAGRKAGSGGSDVILATSFFDGGYRGPWACTRGLEEEGGKVVSNFVGHYKEEEFTVDPMVDALNTHTNARVAACFSTYLATLFFKKMNQVDASFPETEYYCSSFMGEEQTMHTYSLPQGKFFTYVPWLSSLGLKSNEQFVAEVMLKKNKQANIFHVLGWEAGILIAQILSAPSGMEAEFNHLLEGGSYESPRGKVTIHPTTHIAYAPLYYCEMKKDEDGKNLLMIHDTVEISGDEHLQVLNDQPEGVTSGWFNNYLCT
ncbi:MAG: hypothetical protein A3D92_03010 [Bacteroidetes bacterium RIFCSPHIGHO2_02_FULL_44_7]|nr:MAG: hypothetical protein A3D92_03010 [Bacteroidetes bacterium RIFCSPHIGHO2_02_FULL_44_7]